MESLNFFSCEVPTATTASPQPPPDQEPRASSTRSNYSSIEVSVAQDEEDDLLLLSEHSSQPSLHARRRGRASDGSHGTPRTRPKLEHMASMESDAADMDYDVIPMPKPDNILEANRMVNNYMFGFKKWKSHVSQRPLAERSNTVKDLYNDLKTDTKTLQPVSLCRPGNIIYTLFVGWWVSLIYLIVALLMGLTIIGYPYCKFCLKLSWYFLWPFGKFVLKLVPPSYDIPPTPSSNGAGYPLSGVTEGDETSPLTGVQSQKQSSDCCNLSHKETSFWKRPSTYVWILLGAPILFLVHAIAILLTWITVVFIPAAKINIRAIQKVLFLPPNLLTISSTSLNPDEAFGDIIMYTYKAFNKNYYKYTVDGINVIVFNGLAIVIFTIAIGYGDAENKIFPATLKFVFSLISIMPLSYVIGMAISSISAQSNYAVGAVMNATFGSVVEIVLYITAMVKGNKENKQRCFTELVKSSLVGTLLGTTMLIPGLAMVIGGIKYRSGQRFNPNSAGVTATLLFVSVAGTFAPSIFSKAYGFMSCRHCVDFNMTNPNTTHGMECSQCENVVFGRDGDDSIYRDHVAPLIYTCVTILPLAYIVGLVYSLHTHREAIYDTFAADVQDTDTGHGHEASWGRIKSSIILLMAVVLTCVSAEVLTNNIMPLLTSGISLYFVGATLVALATAIPEIVVGIQFALQNQISLSIEVGNCTAVQVCMVQIPLLVIANAIHNVGFYLIFNDIHIWTVIIGVLIMNYVFQDGKANYFQGTSLVLTWIMLLAMYYFAPTAPDINCGEE